MLALFAVFEHISNIRRLLNRFSIFSKAIPTKIEEEPYLDLNEDQREILLGPILNHMRVDERLICFEREFQEEQIYFARELDACLLEMREIERDLHDFKQRQCSFYERYLDFLEKKDQLIEEYIQYHEKYFFKQPLSPRTKQLQKQSTIYEFNIPISNRFELFKP